jgi:hypothetical protein
MSIEQRKIALISWITTLNDEAVISQIENYQKTSIESFPKEIVELLNNSMAEADEDCITHTTVQDILDLKK